MKSQLSLNELAQKLTDQKSLKKDYIVESGNVRFYSNGSNQLHLQEIDEVFDVNDVALNQITTKVGLSKKYTDKMLEIVNIQRAHHPVKDLHVWFLGDIVEGEEIFPGQSHLIDSGLYRQVGVYGPQIISTFITKALQNFETVKATGVIGNHGAVGGRARKSHDPETNMDRLLYKIVSLIFKDEPRFSFHIPDGIGERNWYAVDTIGSYSTMLIHGDQLPQPSNFGAYYKKVMGWKDGAVPEHFDDVFMGHYHQQFKMTIGSTILRISGSSESYNTYAQEYFQSMSRPCQHLMFVHPEHGVTSEYSIWLD